MGFLCRLFKAKVQKFVSLFNSLYLYLFNHAETLVLNLDFCPKQRDFKLLVPLTTDTSAREKNKNMKADVKEIICDDVACVLLLLTVKFLVLTNTVTTFRP